MSGKIVNVLKYKDGCCRTEDDLVAEEVLIRVYTNGLLFGTLVCSPWDLEELAVGYLCIKGMIRSYGDVRNVEVLGDSVYVEYRTDAREDADEDWTEPTGLSAGDIVRLAGELDRLSSGFHQTGGVHNAALSDGKVILMNTEDVSRHNAMERLVGRCLMRGVSLKDKVIVFSGRVPEEIIRVVAKMRCSAIVSVSAPTSRAIEIAEQNGVMLVCFARGEHFNVYTYKERLLDVQP